jgi:predicted dehydrogenase
VPAGPARFSIPGFVVNSSNDPTPSRHAPGPVGVALVGHGYWGRHLARNVVAAPSTTLVGVVDIDEQALARASRIHLGVETWTHLEAALEDDRVEAIVVATPASTHADIAAKALESDRHVLVEKPLAASEPEAVDLVARAREKRLTLMVGHTFLYSVPVNRLRDWIGSGELGRVRHVRSQRMSIGRVRHDVNALWNLAPHDLSILLYLLEERPVAVSSLGFSFVREGIEDVCTASLEFASGVVATVHVSWADPVKTRLMTVVGDEKMAIYDDLSPERPLALVDNGGLALTSIEDPATSGDPLIPTLDLVEPLLLEITDFGEACATGRIPKASAEQGLDVVRILAALDRSMRDRGNPVMIEW